VQAPRIALIGRLDACRIDQPSRMQSAFDTYDFVRAIGSVDHRHRAEEALPADMLFLELT